MSTRKHVISNRLVLIATAIALCFGAIPALLDPASAAAQAEELTQREFDRLVEDVIETEPTFGPEDGELEHDPEIVTMAFAEVEAADVVVSATFQNPFAASRQQFDFGIQIRSTTIDDEAQYVRFVVFSDGTWGIADAVDGVLVSDTYDDLDDGRNGENTLAVYAEGDLAHFAINGDYVGSAEVSLEDAGDVSVGTAFAADSYRDGASTGFTGFTVWDLGGESEPADDDDDGGRLGPINSDQRNEPEDDGDQDEPRPSDDQDEGDSRPSDQDDQEDEPEGTRYESPTYGYTLTYDDTWEQTSDGSSEGIDTVTLEDENTTLEFFGLPGAQTPEECRDTLITFYATNVEESGLAATLENTDDGEIEEGSRAGSSFMEVLISVEVEGGEPIDYTLYVECGPLDGSEFLVAVQHTIFGDDLRGAARDRAAVVDTLALAGAEPEGSGTNRDDEEPADDDDGPVDDEPATNANAAENIVPVEGGGWIYTSPTFGFVVGILPDWTVEQNTVQGGYDTLVVSRGSGRVTVSGFASTNTAIGCIDSILNNLGNDPSIIEYSIGVDEDGNPFRFDSETQSEVGVFITFNVNGSPVYLVRYYACFAGSDGQSMLVFAYEAPEEDFQTEFENIDAMLDLIRVP